MKYYVKNRILSSLLLCFCVYLCLSLTACRNYDNKVFDFYQNNQNGKFNVIEIDFGENNSAVYYIDESYGIWSLGEDKFLFLILEELSLKLNKLFVLSTLTAFLSFLSFDSFI